eukprot:Em0008g406a
MIRPRANTDVTQALTALIRCKKTGRVDVHGAKRKEKPYRFQKKAHEEQSGFNGLDDHLEEAEVQMARAARLLSDGPAKAALEKAKQRVKRVGMVMCGELVETNLLSTCIEMLSAYHVLKAVLTQSAIIDLVTITANRTGSSRSPSQMVADRIQPIRSKLTVTRKY